jgi:hypothetical protein
MSTIPSLGLALGLSLRVVNGYDPVTGNPRQASRNVHGGTREANKARAAFVTEVDTG